jgi:sortase B
MIMKANAQKKKTTSSSKQVRGEARKKKQMRGLLQGLFLGFCIALLIFSIWKLASIFLGYQSGDKEYDDLRQYVLEDPVSPDELDPETLAEIENDEGDNESDTQTGLTMTRIDLTGLQAINEEAIGWIEIPGTSINYPMLHTTDDAYYLTHTFNKTENKSGAIFIETLNQPDFSDLHTIVYGHNMKNGSMFAGLKNYQAQSYYNAHPYIYVDLGDASHCYQIFSAHEAELDDISYTIGYAADDKYADFLNSIKSSSLYDTGVDVDVNDSVITLSTCTKSGTKRFVVHAKKIY